MTQPIFFEPELTFAKVAAETILPEDPNAWPTELMQELYRQVPYIADFEPHVTMDRVDAERGFGFGHVEVTNQTEIQHGAPPDAMQAAGVHTVRIPIVIKDRKLQPLDLLVTADSKMLPLTEQRLRQIIFRPQAFDITGRGPGDMSMIGQLYPPYRQNYGFGGGGATMSVGMGKEGSARLLPIIVQTIRPSQYEAFFSKFANDQHLQAAYTLNGHATVEALSTLAKWEAQDQRKLASALLHHLEPTVIQLRKEDEGYSLKTASHRFFMPETRSIDRGEAVRLLGPKIVLAADEQGSVTMATGDAAGAAPPMQAEGAAPPVDSANVEEDTPELISQFGIYKVQDSQGRHIIGYVFPNLYDIDGQVLPIALFNNGSQKAVQGEIVGVNVGGGASIFEGPPSGMGCFYRLLTNGRAEAVVPMTIKASMSAPDEGGVTFHAETFDGRPVQVVIAPGIEKATATGEGELLIPDTYAWMPLDKAQDVQLASTPDEFSKEAQVAAALTTVQVRCSGDTFAFSGFPVEKVAADQLQFLDVDDSLFLLGGMGVDLKYGKSKLGEAAAFGRVVDVKVNRYLKTASSEGSELQEKAAAVAARLGSYCAQLKCDLVKEAAVIPDPMAVDTVLSLGFINSENLGVFLSYMPVIDDSISKMCELLLAARLGLRDVSVSALEKAIRAADEVLTGLKVMAFSTDE